MLAGSRVPTASPVVGSTSQGRRSLRRGGQPEPRPCGTVRRTGSPARRAPLRRGSPRCAACSAASRTQLSGRTRRRAGPVPRAAAPRPLCTSSPPERHRAPAPDRSNTTSLLGPRSTTCPDGATSVHRPESARTPVDSSPRHILGPRGLTSAASPSEGFCWGTSAQSTVSRTSSTSSGGSSTCGTSSGARKASDSSPWRSSNRRPTVPRPVDAEGLRHLRVHLHLAGAVAAEEALEPCDQLGDGGARARLGGHHGRDHDVRAGDRLELTEVEHVDPIVLGRRLHLEPAPLGREVETGIDVRVPGVDQRHRILTAADHQQLGPKAQDPAPGRLCRVEDLNQPPHPDADRTRSRAWPQQPDDRRRDPEEGLEHLLVVEAGAGRARGPLRSGRRRRPPGSPGYEDRSEVCGAG